MEDRGEAPGGHPAPWPDLGVTRRGIVWADARRGGIVGSVGFAVHRVRRQLWSCIAALVAVWAVLLGVGGPPAEWSRAAEDAAWVGCEHEPGRQVLRALGREVGGDDALVVEEEAPERAEAETAPSSPVALDGPRGAPRGMSWPAQRWSRVQVWADGPGVVCVGAAPPAPGGAGKGRWIAPEGQRGPPA